MFTQCSLNVHSMFTQCSLNVQTQGVYPTNDAALVQQMAARLGVSETDVILVSEGSCAKRRSTEGNSRSTEGQLAVN
jgi:hypothetical protein